jgi:hypothetical protein
VSALIAKMWFLALPIWWRRFSLTRWMNEARHFKRYRAAACPCLVADQAKRAADPV